MRELLRRLRADGHGLVIDAFVAEEARRNIRGKVGTTRAPAVLEEWIARCGMAASAATSKVPREAGALPGKDRPVLAAAIRARCDALVSGDRSHVGFLCGRTVGGVAVHSPRSLAESLGLIGRAAE